MNRKVLLASLAFLAVASAPVLGADANPMIGTWVMNAAKSKFEPGPPLKSYIVSITDEGGGKLKDHAEWVNADGSKEETNYTFTADAKEAPVTGYANADTVRMERVKPNENKMTMLKAGKPREFGHYIVSADGKTMHATEWGTDATGAKYKATMVFDRR